MILDPGHMLYQLTSAGLATVAIFSQAAPVFAQQADSQPGGASIVVAFISVSATCFGALAFCLRELFSANREHAAASKLNAEAVHKLAESILQMAGSFNQYQQQCRAHGETLARLEGITRHTPGEGVRRE